MTQTIDEQANKTEVIEYARMKAAQRIQIDPYEKVKANLDAAAIYTAKETANWMLERIARLEAQRE